MTDKLTTIAGRPISDLTREDLETALSMAVHEINDVFPSTQAKAFLMTVTRALSPKPIEDSLTYMGKPISDFTEEQAKAALAFVLIDSGGAKCELHQRKAASDRLYDLMNA